MNRLKNKVAVVTGASKGFGASIARHFAAEGAAVVVNYASSKADADRVVAEIASKGGRAVAVRANVGNREDVQLLFAETKKAFGRLDVLVNNAGTYEFQDLNDITEEQFHKHFNLNVLGVILTTQEAAKYFGPEGGSIVNMSSILSITPMASAPVYSATKGAVDALSKAMAKALASRRIRVNTLHPSLIATEGVLAQGSSESGMLEWMKSVTPLNRLGTPDDVALSALFLASDESSFITGEGIVLAGGYR